MNLSRKWLTEFVDLGLDEADDREFADVALFADGGLFRNGGPGADSLAAGLGGVVHFEEPQDAGGGVIHLDEGRRNGLRGFERTVDQDDRSLRRVEIGLVFGVGEIGQRTGFSLLDRGYGVYRGVFVAEDVAAQKSGDHFGREFHHSRSFRGIGLCRFLGAGTPRRCVRRRALRGPSTRRCRPRGPG